MNRTAAAATTAGAFVAAGIAAKVLNRQQVGRRRRRRGEEVAFGSVHGTEHTVVADDGLRLHVEVDDGPEQAPADAPTVVFLHGVACTLDSWHYQRLALRGRVRMVFVDQRSHGGSDRSDASHCTIEQLASDAHRVIEELVPDGPIVLVGHSMGGMVVMSLAGEHPKLFGDRVVGTVLLSTAPGELFGSAPGLHRLVTLLKIGSPLIEWGRGFNSYSVVKRWAVGPDAPERHADMTNEMILQSPLRVVIDFYPMFASLDLRALDALAEVPTTVVSGTHDLITPLRHSKRLVEMVEGARLTVLEGTGHMSVFEEHERVTHVIEDTLEAGT